MEEVRRIVINKVTEVDEDKKEVQGAYWERRVVSKIEEGD